MVESQKSAGAPNSSRSEMLINEVHWSETETRAIYLKEQQSKRRGLDPISQEPWGLFPVGYVWNTSSRGHPAHILVLEPPQLHLYSELLLMTKALCQSNAEYCISPVCVNLISSVTLTAIGQSRNRNWGLYFQAQLFFLTKIKEKNSIHMPVFTSPYVKLHQNMKHEKKQKNKENKENKDSTKTIHWPKYRSLS